ncbi:MAG: hypothetical protein IJG34_06670 [Synergistaceae bacterium]|nr:hypothetical protein [Synergistaceae bacterium]MBQ9628607.1 hypothetical protein [Synergistaceae bacterium]
MKRDKGFSMETVRRDDFHGGRNEYRISDRFSDEDIERALREASIKVGKFVMPEERRA